MKYFTTLAAGVMMSGAAYAQNISLNVGYIDKTETHYVTFHGATSDGERWALKMGAFANEAFHTTDPDNGQAVYHKAYRSGKDANRLLIDALPYESDEAARATIRDMPAFPGHKTYEIIIPDTQAEDVFSHVALPQGEALPVRLTRTPSGW